MSLPIYQRVAVTDAGDVIPGAEYTVINENTGVAAPIYSDRTGATLLSAPYFADSVGTIQFFIAAGTTFRVAASGGVGTYTDRYIYAAHPQASATDTTAGSLMAVGAFGLGGDIDLRNTIYSTGTPDGLIGKGYAIGLGSGSALGVVVTGVGTLEVAGVYGGTGVHSGFTRRFTAQGRTFVQSGLSGAAWGDWNEVITANAAGNVGIGTSSPSGLAKTLNIDGGAGGSSIAIDGGNNFAVTFVGATVGDPTSMFSNTGFKFATATAKDATGFSEKMRLDSAGHLLVGKTSSSVSVGTGAMVYSDGRLFSSIITGQGSYYVWANSGYRFYANADGGIANYQSNNVNLSDEREKKNIEPLPSQWDCLKNWDVKEFHYNEDDSALPKKYGVIAQQVEIHCPEVISTFKVNDTTERKGVKEQQMMWMAIKALQEAQTRIESLEARITALEAK